MTKDAGRRAASARACGPHWRRAVLTVWVWCGLAVGCVAAARAVTNGCPFVFVVDDFEQGVAAWTNADSARMEWGSDPGSSNRFLRWTARDDGIGSIVFGGLDRRRIDFSRYDILQFRYRVAGKTIWNINPIVQQYPFMQGYRALYYCIDTLDVRLGEWQTFTLDLRLVENSWPNTYSRDRQEFRFEINQLAGAGATEISIDDVVLMRNVLGLERTYAGEWSASGDGSQRWRFSIPVRNGDAAAHRVQAAIAAGSAGRCRGAVSPPEADVPAGTSVTFVVDVTIPADVVRASPPYTGEMVQAEFAMPDVPELRLRTLLPAGIRPAQPRHPCLLALPEQARWIREQYASAATRTNLDPMLVKLVAMGTNVLAYRPQYPPCANGGYGYTVCPVDQTNLVEVAMANLPEATYQCPHCGRFYRGMFYEAAMKGWAGVHRANGSKARGAGINYLVTGDRAYAAKAAEILRGYIDAYLRLPLGALTAGLHTQIPSSGATRIGGSFMQEKDWLTDLAIALDCIRDSGALTEDEVESIRERVLVPSASTMMDHRVGLMNLQWMINGAAVFAGLAADDAAVVARAVYGDHGVAPLMAGGYGADGMWCENPSYINVMALNAYPVLSVLFDSGILAYTPEMDLRYKAPWYLAAPDGRFPTLGTGGPPGMGILINGVKSIARLSKDPEIAWIDAQHPRVSASWGSAASPYFESVAAAFRARAPVSGARPVKPIEPKSMLFPDYGVAVLRTPGTDMYAALAVGRHLVHGHFNKLSVNAYGKGGWFIRNQWGGYGEGFLDFVEPTASSSTIMVDGRSQDADTGELLWQRSTAAAEVVSARERGAWKDVEHERTLVQTADWLLILDRCLAESPHTYDWLYHSTLSQFAWTNGPAVKEAVRVIGELPPAAGMLDGRAAADSPRGRLTTLGDTVCYQYFLPADEVKVASGRTEIAYARKDGSGMRMTLLTDDPKPGLFRTRNPKWSMDGLIFRRRAADAAFAVMLQPHAKGDVPGATVERVRLLDAKTGKAAGLRQAQAVRVTNGGKSVLVVVNYAGVPLKTDYGQVVASTDRVSVLD